MRFHFRWEKKRAPVCPSVDGAPGVNLAYYCAPGGTAALWLKVPPKPCNMLEISRRSKTQKRMLSGRGTTAGGPNVPIAAVDAANEPQAGFVYLFHRHGAICHASIFRRQFTLVKLGLGLGLAPIPRVR